MFGDYTTTSELSRDLSKLVDYAAVVGVLLLILLAVFIPIAIAASNKQPSDKSR